MNNGKFETITVTAGVDLSSQQYKIIAVGGTIAETALAGLGVLQTKSQNGEHATLAIEGHMKAYAGAAITLGAGITVTASGYLATVASGSGTPVGKALVAANSGDLFEFYGNFATAGIVT
jgi:hypothetical protein